MAMDDKMLLNLAFIGLRHRRIFDIPGAERVFLDLVEEVCAAHNVDVIDGETAAECAFLTLRCPLGILPDRLSFWIRKAASPALKACFPQLARMPQVFSGKTWAHAGTMSLDDALNRRTFIDSIR